MDFAFLGLSVLMIAIVGPAVIIVTMSVKMKVVPQGAMVVIRGNGNALNYCARNAVAPPSLRRGRWGNGAETTV